MNEILSQYKEEVEKILAKYPPDFKRSAVMPLLYLAQRRAGHVTPAALADIAEIVGISTTEVSSIAGFYSLYYEDAHGRYHIQVCTDLPCAMRGAGEFLEQLSGYLGIQPGQTTPDGLFTLEAVKCLAACHRAPLFQVQGDGEIDYHEEQTLQTAIQWIEEVRQRAAQQRAAQQRAAQQQAAQAKGA